MTSSLIIIYSNDIQDKHRSILENFFETAGSEGDLLTIMRTVARLSVTLDEEPIAIGGIKPKTTEDFHKDKADLMNMENS